MTKKIVFFLTCGVFIILGIFVFFAESGKNINQRVVSQPTPTPFRSEFINRNLNSVEKTEYDAELNYAVNREKENKEKPWLKSLPLKSDNYYVLYDPSANKFLVSLYVFKYGVLDPVSQIEVAKKESLQGMTEIGINTTLEKIEFNETGR